MTTHAKQDLYYLIESGAIVYASREQGLVIVYTGPELDAWREVPTALGGGYKHLDTLELHADYTDPDEVNLEAVTQEAEDWVVSLLSDMDVSEEAA